MKTGIKTGADSGHGGRFGENFGIGTNAHFQILAPRPLFDEHLFQPHGFGRAGLQFR